MKERMDLFAPTVLAEMRLRSRIVRSATNDYSGNSDGSVSRTQLDLYRELAKTPIGLLITGNFFVCEDGRLDAFQNSLAERWHPDSVRALTETVHRAGGTVVFQLSHARAKTGNPQDALPECLSQAQIAGLIRAFAAGARRAQEAGADGVQIHCGHGYLLSDFLDPVRNRRKDCYGGNVSGRIRMVEEIVRETQRVCGPAYPLLLKVNTDRDPEGLALLCRRARALGIAAVELSGVNFSSFGKKDACYYLSAARALKREVTLPLIVTGGIRSRADAEQALSSGADFVGLSRPLLCEPDLVSRWERGEAVSRCVSCCNCFSLYKETGRRCVMHARPPKGAQET